MLGDMILLQYNDHTSHQNKIPIPQSDYFHELDIDSFFIFSIINFNCHTKYKNLKCPKV